MPFTPQVTEIPTGQSIDVIIIGAGSAGLTSAIQAYESGLFPVIIEKMPTVGGNTARASSGLNAAGTAAQRHRGINDTAAAFARETARVGHHKGDPELIRTLADHSAAALSWLADHAIALTDVTITGGMRVPRAHRPASTAPVGQALVSGLLAEVDRCQIPVLCATQVTELCQDATGAVTGVVITQACGTRTLSATAVILATGGFGASHDRLGKLAHQLTAYPTTNHAGATGDGLDLATAVGSATANLTAVQIHPTAHVVPDTGRTFLIGETVRGEGAILVNHSGERFVNELADRQTVVAAIAQQPGRIAWLVSDRQVAERVQAMQFYRQMGFVVAVDRFPNLAATLVSYGQGVDDFGRQMAYRPLDVASLEAICVQPAVHYTMGGVVIAPDAAVLTPAGRPIASLYAAGEVTTGVHGDNRVGGNSLAETVIFGRQAAQSVARYCRQHAE